MILTGRMMDAAEAERSGLVSRIVPAASLVEEALKVAASIAALSRPAVYAAKEAVNRAQEDDARRRDPVRAPLSSIRCSPPKTRKEGMRAFAEKRAGRLQAPVERAHGADGVIGSERTRNNSEAVRAAIAISHTERT